MGDETKITQYRMMDPEAVEVTVCGSPAVPVAKFLNLRALPQKVQLGDTKEAQVTLGIPLQHVERRQAFGYASAPWIQDYYGDMLNLRDIETAQNTFMKNIHNGTAWGSGVGEEHYLFFENAHVVASAIDYTGSIGGIPGGWWFGVQFDNTQTWEKVLSGEYTGFSMTSYVDWKLVGSGSTLDAIADAIPNLASKEAAKTFEARLDGMKKLGIYTYPAEKSKYADNTNARLPIDTAGRALLVLDYLSSTTDGYDKTEYKTALQRTVKALDEFKITLPDKLYTKLSLEIPKREEAETKKSVPAEPVRVIGRSGHMPRPEDPKTTPTRLDIQSKLREIGDPTGPVNTTPNPAQIQNAPDNAQGNQATPPEPPAQADAQNTQSAEAQVKEESFMTPEEIRQVVAEGIKAGVAEVMQSMKADADAQKAAEIAQKTAAEAEAKNFELLAKSVVEQLKADGIIEVKKSSEPSAEDVFKQGMQSINEGLTGIQGVLGKLQSAAPGAATRGLLSGNMPPAMRNQPQAREITLRDDETGRSFVATKDDIAVAMKWAKDNDLSPEIDGIEACLQAAAAEEVLPSQTAMLAQG